uniref:Uncharacterized protein n=1 Tax=Plectus sambesii TaxID=2011161 RepID=A0A914WY67_9BILA
MLLTAIDNGTSAQLRSLYNEREMQPQQKLIGVPTTSCDINKRVRRSGTGNGRKQANKPALWESPKSPGSHDSSTHETTSKRTRFLSVVDTGQRGISVTMSDGTRRRS